MKILWIMIGVIVVLLSVYLYLICPRLLRRPDISGFLGTHYAHRGLFDNRTNAPENSINAIQKAVEAGYGIEFDVQLTKDDVPVVFHDASLKRMCGVEGNIWDYTWQELRKFRLADSDQTIPALEKVLRVVDGRVPLIIEYKMDRADTVVCELGNRLLKQYQGKYCVESFHPFALRWYRKHRPDIVRGQLSENFTKHGEKNPVLNLLTYLLTNFLTRPDFVAYRHSDAGNLSRRICRKLGALSVAWTVKNQEEYERARTQFDLFIFDSFLPRRDVKEGR